MREVARSHFCRSHHIFAFAGGRRYSMIISRMPPSMRGDSKEEGCPPKEEGLSTNSHPLPPFRACFHASKRRRQLRFGMWSPQDRAWLCEVERRYEAFRYLRGGILRAACPPGPALSEGIPRIVHQIWLGPRPIPPQCAAWMAGWRALALQRRGPGYGQQPWQYRLWRDADVDALVPPLANRAALDAAPNYGEKSDYVRYELLLRFGGLYVDVDFECFCREDRNIRSLHRQCRFYAGLSATATVELNNGLIACTPGHPLMARIVGALPSWRRRMARCAMASSGRSDAAEKDPTYTRTTAGAMDTISRSGPGHFTRVALGALLELPSSDAEGVLLLPPSFFYPLPNDCRGISLGARRACFARPESLAMHHWFASWQE